MGLNVSAMRLVAHMGSIAETFSEHLKCTKVDRNGVNWHTPKSSAICAEKSLLGV
jgi:hypothetical protein